MKTSQSSVAGKEMRESQARPVYPFTAIVGQDEMKLALVLNIIDPSIGGVLIMGHRGTGKSTAVRGLADLLPQIWKVRGCSYQCDPGYVQNLCHECATKLSLGEKLQREPARIPVVDLPLGATEDRVCGTIDIGRALKDGVKAFEPGLLARANRGFLYIDEVNLLEDHLVDLLLDVAATGYNKVERESISVEHPARFVLIGSGNPEEGELRPQLLDRFGLHVEVTTENDLDSRVEIVEQREAFERDPASFCAGLEQEQEELRQKITRAQKSSATVKADRPLLRQIAELCSALKIDGHRGELTIARAARALAALEGRKKVAAEDVKRVSLMALRHRLRRDPLGETASTERIQQALDRVFAEAQPTEKPSRGRSSGDDHQGGGLHGTSGGIRNETANERRFGKGARARSRSTQSQSTQSQSRSLAGKHGGDSPAEPPSPATEAPLTPQLRLDVPRRGERRPSSAIARQHQRRDGVKHICYNSHRGRYVRATSSRKNGARVAVDATLRAAAGATYQGPGPGGFHLTAPDTRYLTPLRIPAHALQFKELSQKNGRLFIFAVDASGSMALNRISQAKSAVLSLLKQSYIRRDSVALVGFRGSAAEVLLPPSRSMLRARRALDSLGVGGGTPLSAGLACSLELAKRAQAKHGEVVLVLFTDGHANVAVRANGNPQRALRTQNIENEMLMLGRELRKVGVRMVVVDTSNGFGSDDARGLADKLGAHFEKVRFGRKPGVSHQS